ncbi:MAG TPA: hypothetical protein VK817_26855 [Trebonia sp.]|nr:hypothetical protein [Trebonia sp.]
MTDGPGGRVAVPAPGGNRNTNTPLLTFAVLGQVITAAERFLDDVVWGAVRDPARGLR